MTTHQSAAIDIVNETGGRLLSVSVAHKYSDVYKNSHSWENISNGSTTSDTRVDFNTGWLTTGRDWWVISWVDEKGDTYMTDPQNFRDIVDFLEKITNGVAGPLSKLATIVATGSPEPSSKLVAAAAAVTAGITSALLNSESTVGYKQHILREEDCSRATRIIIKADEVEFNSESGVSTTGFRKV